MPHPFDEALQLTPAADNRFHGATHAAYANMVGPYGGITAAVLLQAALQHPARLGEPISQTVNFAAPIADGPFEIEATPLRTNRSTQHWMLLMRQQGAVCTSGTAVFAVRRPTWRAQEATPPQGLPPPESLERGLRPGAPAWVQRYDMRFPDDGGAPFQFDGQEQPHSNSRFWIRDQPPRPLCFAALASICDSFYPRLFIRRHKVSLIGTVSLTTFFHTDAAQLAALGERYLIGTARALNYHDGYFDQSAEVWSDEGALLASTHQMVYYRD